MKNIIIASDSHGRGELIKEIISRNASCGFDVNEIIFLGDGVRDFLCNVPRGIRVYAVKGNCDGFSSAFSGELLDGDGNFIPDERLEIIAGKRILIMHGHKYSVKSGLSSAICRALELSADILLFGHTHCPLEKQLKKGDTLFGSPLSKPLYIFNPGALYDGSFGVLTIQNGTILLSHGCV